MKINIIGGGPAGMYFAILMKKADPAHDITIFERNGPDDTFGWGVVFSGKTLRNLQAADEESHAQITRSFAAWDNVDVVHRSEKISIRGNSFSGIARLQLLKILQARCEQLGIRLLFRKEVAEFESLRTDCDLLVAADGVNSLVRKQYSEKFAPTLDVRPNRYIWFGTNKLFHGLTLTFRQNEAGVFAAHSYKFNQTTSTFIIECDQETWERAGFADLDDEQTRTYLEGVFAADLEAQPLLSNNSKWINFLLVKNANWRFENLVLLGDALHTAHFSIGSGTKLAMEDAIALHTSVRKTITVQDALADFELTRKPVIEEYQAAALESMRWFENARDYMHLSPIELAYELMTRSGKVTREDLERRDASFVKAYEDATRNCFSAGTEVKTQSGWKTIEGISRGELVWTHRGRLRQVAGVQVRPHVGRLKGIRLKNQAAVVWVTPDHHFLSPSPLGERGRGGEIVDAAHNNSFASPLRRKQEIWRRLEGNNPRLQVLARELRQHSTPAEEVLWERLRGRRLCGAKFRRHHPLGQNYILNFYCPESRLGIELDGNVHDSERAAWEDGIRQRRIQHAGVRILRFQNERVFEDIDDVLSEIAEHLRSPQAESKKEIVGAIGANPTPNPSPQAGRGKNTLWRKAEDLEVGSEVIFDESGQYESIEETESRFVNETVYDLTVEDDHSFVTKAGVVHNCG